MYRLPDIDLPLDFPDDFETTDEGILAVGGNLHPKTLVNAYAKGIFPWFSEGDPILWWHPNPRFVLFPKDVKISKSMKPTLNQSQCVSDLDQDCTKKYRITFDKAFQQAIEYCAGKSLKNREETWILPEMIEAYCELAEQGYAHSVEVWNQNDELVGGLCGLAMGKVFFGDSMFSLEPNTSKLALIYLCQELEKQDFLLIDCQIKTKHLVSLGATEIPREEFLDYLEKAGASSLVKTDFSQ